MSQVSEGGFSDILPGGDVDQFIDENGIRHEMNLLHEPELANEDYKLPAEVLLNELNNYAANLPKNEKTNFPPSEPSNLCNDDYPGPLGFEVLILPNGQKTPWEFSSKLNKIFIGMGMKFPVAFSLKTRPDWQLFVRATPAFSQAQFFQELVHRCLGHEHGQDGANIGLPVHVLQHIIRCNSTQARYYGNKNSGKRLSVVFPLGVPQVGTDLVKEFFHFVCKNSCPSGMNRRPIEVIFTLEDENGRVLGRRVVCVRICSCPKRDKEKEEKEMDKSQEPTVKQGKKRKLDNSTTSDTKILTINADIVGAGNYQKVLEMARSLMAEGILKCQTKKVSDAPFRKCWNEISESLNKIPK